MAGIWQTRFCADEGDSETPVQVSRGAGFGRVPGPELWKMSAEATETLTCDCQCVLVSVRAWTTSFSVLCADENHPALTVNVVVIQH